MFRLGSNRRATFLLAASIVLCLAAVVYHFALRDPSVGDDAKGIADSLIDHDASALARYINPRELKALGWFRKHAQDFLAQVLMPKCAGVTFARRGATTATGNGTSGWFDCDFRMPDGRVLEGTSQAFLTDDGGRTLIGVELQRAWMVAYFREHPTTSGQDWRMVAVKQGIVADYQTLKTWGFTGFVTTNPGDPIRPLDGAFRRAEDYLKTHSLAGRPRQ